MKSKFTRKEQLLNRLVLHSMDNASAIGLLYGQTGIAAVLARYARASGESDFEIVADALIDNVTEKIKGSKDISFAYGISGICWGIEYLIQEGIMPGPGHGICEKADEYVMKTPPYSIEDFSLERGLPGLWHYVWARIQGNMIAALPLPFTERYLSSWYKIVSENPEEFPHGAAERLHMAMEGKLVKMPLSIATFVKLPRRLDENNLSLRSGIAGVIETKYNQV